MTKPAGTLSLAAAAGFAVIRLVSHAAVADEPTSVTASAKTSATEITVTADGEPEGPCRHVREYLLSKGSGCFPDSVHEFMIATVPDPVATQLALVFDRSIESILSAFDDSGWDFATYWLPWEAPPFSGTEAPKPTGKQENTGRKHREGEPGMLLFRNRRRPAPERYFGVLLVGETPTSGIRRDVFDKAVQYVRHNRGDEEIRLLGPTFSGSVDSLKQIIQGRGAFRTISGTATGRQVRDLKTRPLFESTVNDDQSGINFLTQILGEKYSRREIAIVSEAETSYGSTAASGPENASWNFYQFRFPRGIWRLRNAYQDSETSKTPAETKSQPVRRSLPVELRDTTSGRDGVPIFATAQTPSSQDAVLGSIAATLQRTHIPLAIVAASDPLDVIFVTSYLRTACPDVRLVVLGSDLLLANAAADLPLQGVLSVTTYPLFTRNQWWTGGRNDADKNGGRDTVRRVVLASRSAQGVYNAARALLLGSGGKNQNALLEYSRPGVTSKEEGPPIWITVLGRDGYWPVAVETPPSPQDRFALEGQPLTWPAPSRVYFHMERLPRGWLTVFVLWSFALGFVDIMALGSISSRWQSRAFTVNYTALIYPSEPLDRAVYLLLTLLAIMGGYITLVAPLWRIFYEHHGSAGYLFGTAASIAAGLVLFTLGSIAAIARHCVREESSADRDPCPDPRIPKRRDTGYRVLAAAGLGLYLIFGFLLWRAFAHGHDDTLRSFFFSYRGLDLGGGVSPILPLLLLELALAHWGWIQGRRMQFHVERAIPLPSIEREPDPPLKDCEVRDLPQSDARALAANVERVITEPFLGWQWRVVCATALTILVTLLVWEYVRSVDSGSYDAAFVLLLALSLFLLFLTWSRFLVTWFSLRTLLEKLDQHPIREAFSAMPAEAAWSPILQRSMMRRTYAMETRARDVALRIASVIPHGEVPHGDLWDAEPLRQAVEGLLSKVQSGCRITPADRCATHQALAPLFEAARKGVYVNAWNRGCSLSGKKSDDHAARLTLVERPPSKEEQLQVLYAEFLATPYLVFIRSTLLQMRNLLIFVAAGFVMAALAPNVYPFQSRHLIGWIMTSLLLAFGIGVAIVWAQIDRDGLLSKITDRPAGSIDSVSFALRLVAFGGLPLLTVIATQFPSVSHFLFSWVQPTLQALR